jgi:hypothetical protein
LVLYDITLPSELFSLVAIASSMRFPFSPRTQQSVPGLAEHLGDSHAGEGGRKGKDGRGAKSEMGQGINNKAAPDGTALEVNQIR